MSENGLMDSVNDVVKAAFELYAADGKKLNDGDSLRCTRAASLMYAV